MEHFVWNTQIHQQLPLFPITTKDFYGVETTSIDPATCLYHEIGKTLGINLYKDGSSWDSGLRLVPFRIGAGGGHYYDRSVITTQTTSLVQKPNPVNHTVDEYYRFFQELMAVAQYILHREGVPQSKAADLFMLTSAWDAKNRQGRSKLGFQSQLDIIKAGFTWQEVAESEALGIPVLERKQALALPAELRESLYKKPDRYTPSWVAAKKMTYGVTTREYASLVRFTK